MKRELVGPILSAVFVDYDNIYLSLKRKSDEAAKQFAKDAHVWIRAIENGQLITATHSALGDTKRRIVMNRCYGNPVPRRNAHDNSTDMNSFPFVRHHFLRAGFEVVDCPPLTAQLKNSADIRMVMDMRDYLTHETYFDEFIILSGDADFTPVLHRLRQHARRTVIFANDHTVAPYKAICDGEVRESDLIALLLEGRPLSLPEQQRDRGLQAPRTQVLQPQVTPSMQTGPAPIVHTQQALHADPATVPLNMAPVAQPLEHTPTPSLSDIRGEIIGEIVNAVRAASSPVPLEALADRAVRALGHDRTIGTSWAGTGGFRELLRQYLPADIRLSDQPPYFAFDPRRHGGQERAAPVQQPAHGDGYVARGGPPARQEQFHQPAPAPTAYAPADDMTDARVGRGVPQTASATPAPAPLLQRPLASNYAQQQQAVQPQAIATRAASSEPMFHRAAPAASAPVQPAPARPEAKGAVHQAIQRIYDAAQVPQMAPAEYRLVFEMIASEINENDLNGGQTLTAIQGRLKERGLDLGRDTVDVILQVVSEADPWFENGASVNIFAGRFRNYVVTRCRTQGLSLSSDELDLIDGWFTSGNVPQMPARAVRYSASPTTAPTQSAAPQMRSFEAPAPLAATAPEPRPAPAATGGRWWSLEDGRQPASEARQPAREAVGGPDESDDFPRIIRTRSRG